MRIGFDLDKVFIDYPPFAPHFIIDWLYRNNFSSTLSYRIPKDPVEISFRKLTHLPLFRPGIKQNIGFIQVFSQNHPDIYLISSRYNFLKKITDQLLERFNLRSCFARIYLNTQNEQPHLFKERVIKELGLEIYIDDDLDLLRYLKEHCPKTQLFWYSPRTTDIQIPGIITLTNLSDIEKYSK